jgi:hypothetical protein
VRLGQRQGAAPRTDADFARGRGVIRHRPRYNKCSRR